MHDETSDNGMTLSKEDRKKVFKKLLQHLKEGFSKDSFSELSDKTIQSYLINYPEEFVTKEYNKALRQGKHSWEAIGKLQSTGECLGNSRSWYYNMSNRYGWRDKVDLDADVRGSIKYEVINYGSNSDQSKGDAGK